MCTDTSPSAYHAFAQAGVVAQGLLQYPAVVAPKLVCERPRIEFCEMLHSASLSTQRCIWRPTHSLSSALGTEAPSNGSYLTPTPWGERASGQLKISKRE
jgi:hypothetical protein